VNAALEREKTSSPDGRRKGKIKAVTNPCAWRRPQRERENGVPIRSAPRRPSVQSLPAEAAEKKKKKEKEKERIPARCAKADGKKKKIRGTLLAVSDTSSFSKKKGGKKGRRRGRRPDSHCSSRGKKKARAPPAGAFLQQKEKPVTEKEKNPFQAPGGGRGENDRRAAKSAILEQRKPGVELPSSYRGGRGEKGRREGPSQYVPHLRRGRETALTPLNIPRVELFAGREEKKGLSQLLRKRREKRALQPSCHNAHSAIKKSGDSRLARRPFPNLATKKKGKREGGKGGEGSPSTWPRKRWLHPGEKNRAKTRGPL